jgi:hypothetical protein
MPENQTDAPAGDMHFSIIGFADRKVATIRVELVPCDGFDDDEGGKVGYLLPDREHPVARLALHAPYQEWGELLAWLALGMI